MLDQVAPELPTDLDWLNTGPPPPLHGSACALAFVNAGSTWSQQRLQELGELQARYSDRLRVLAIHVPRFDHERDPQRMRKALGIAGIKVPVALDPHWTLWQRFGIQAWPTVLLIDAQGQVRETIVGAGDRPQLDQKIAAFCADAPPSMRSAIAPDREPLLALRFPTGITVQGGYLYVADSGHHRILECDLSGRVLRQFGNGAGDLVDGPADLAAFKRPQGLSVQRGAVYVADTGNHAVRRIDLRSGDVVTLCGNGKPGMPSEGLVANPTATALDAPRSLALLGGELYIACAGSNRIWSYDLGTRHMRLEAGSGNLAVRDGNGSMASFAQPVGLSTVHQTLYVCDEAGSAIRSFNARTGQVSTMIGRDPWSFGNNDGARNDAQLQAPQALALDPDAPLLWIADTGNSLLRQLRLGGGELKTVALPEPLHGPTGVAVADGTVWIADTEAHAILRLDKHTNTLRHVPIGE